MYIINGPLNNPISTVASKLLLFLQPDIMMWGGARDVR